MDSRPEVVAVGSIQSRVNDWSIGMYGLRHVDENTLVG
jgi:hypothetical protein